MVTVIENGHDEPSSNHEAVYFSYSANTLWKGMNPIILPPAIDKE